MLTTLRALIVLCAVLTSSCQAVSGLDRLTTDGIRDDSAQDASHTDEGYFENRTSRGVLERSFAPEPADFAQDLDAGEENL